MFICLDPGHSGPAEPGACFHNLHEADLNLAIALQTANALRQSGASVCLTRAENIVDDSLTWRAEFANTAGCDAFLSIHCNAAEDDTARGIESYYYPGSAPGRFLAGSVQNELNGLRYSLDRGVKDAFFTVLAATSMPAVLVECGFITQYQDRQILCAPSWQQAIGQALARSLLNVSV